MIFPEGIPVDCTVFSKAVFAVSELIEDNDLISADNDERNFTVSSFHFLE